LWHVGTVHGGSDMTDSLTQWPGDYPRFRRGGGASIESRSCSVVGCSNPANASVGGGSGRPSSDRTPRIKAQTLARTMHRTFMYRNPEGVKGIKAAETTARINITIQVLT